MVHSKLFEKRTMPFRGRSLSGFALLLGTSEAPASGTAPRTAWVANKDFGELELRTSPNFRTSFFFEIANFTELQNFFQQFSKDAAFWKNPEKFWPKFGRNLAKIRQNLANFAKFCKKKNSNIFSNF